METVTRFQHQQQNLVHSGTVDQPPAIRTTMAKARSVAYSTMMVWRFFVVKQIRAYTSTLSRRDRLAVFAVVCLRLSLRHAAQVLLPGNERGYTFISLGRAVKRWN